MNVHKNARTTPIGREQLCRRVLEEGWSVAEAAEALGMSRRTAYKWLSRYREEGRAGLQDRSSRPSHVHGRTSDRRQRLILKLRRTRLTGVQIARQLKMATSTVCRIIQRAGLSRMRDLEPPEPPRRYERDSPGDLLHIDIKKLGRIRGVGHRVTGNPRDRHRGAGWEYVHVCVDDHSRLAYVEVLEDEKAVSAIGFLRRAVAYYERHGITVRQVMTDNGSAYVSYRWRDVCGELGLRHIRTRPYTPRTNGKAERFIQTLLREWAYVRPYGTSAKRTGCLKPWLDHYNRERPHGSLGHRPPISRIPLGP